MVGKYRQFFSVAFFFSVLITPVSFVSAAYDGYPVVIVPGMLASFDKKLMYQDIEDNKWGFVPFGNVYKALINELKGNGYEEGKSLFIAYYDWRKPVSENWSKYLKPKIDEAKKNSGKTKVDLVAHSMGGLLSRAYIQDDRYENDVNKLVMMGTPNQGASEAYIVWEGGYYPSSWTAPYRWFFNSMENSLKKTKNKDELTRPLSFREFFPSIKDLLPTVSFVEDGAGVVSLDKMKAKNDFLIDLNNNIDTLKTRVKETRTYFGVTGKTMEKISLNPTSEEDAKFERWRDGHPIPDPPVANSDQGDETVLLASASVADADNYRLDDTSHVKIPDAARFTIPWFLNPPILWYVPQPFRALAQNLLTVSAVRAEGDEYETPAAMLSFTVSPNVDFELIDPDGKKLTRAVNELGEDNAYFDDDPEDSGDIILVTIRNPKAGKYTLNLLGKTGGEYYVDSTFAGDAGTFEDSNDGTIKAGEEKTLEATVSETGGVDLPESEKKEESDNTATTDNDDKTENKSGGSNGPNTAKNHSGVVLGAATVRLKLSAIILGVRERLTREIASAPKALAPPFAKASEGRHKDYVLLIGPLNEMLTRARAYEAALAGKDKKAAAKLLQQMKGDYADFANKVERLIASGKLDKQTVNVLTALRQRLANAGLR